ncbi:MAG: hypothetical protein ACTHJG_10970 [Rhodanobacteraceae bacterium]
MNRPTSVTVVAWVIIALAIEATIGLFTGFVRAAMSTVIDGPIPISSAAEIGALFEVAAIAFAVFMLRGASWARTAYVVLAIFIILAMIPQTLRHGALVPAFFMNITKTVVLCFFLFRAEANAYFNGGTQTVAQEAANE